MLRFECNKIYPNHISLREHTIFPSFLYLIQIKNDLEEKTSTLCRLTFTRRRRRKETGKAKRLGKTLARTELWVFNNLFQELLEADALKELRMDQMNFNFLAERLYPYLLKKDTTMRASIKPDEQLCLFLRYVASGETFR